MFVARGTAGEIAVKRRGGFPDDARRRCPRTNPDSLRWGRTLRRAPGDYPSEYRRVCREQPARLRESCEPDHRAVPDSERRYRLLRGVHQYRAGKLLSRLWIDAGNFSRRVAKRRTRGKAGLRSSRVSLEKSGAAW